MADFFWGDDFDRAHPPDQTDIEKSHARVRYVPLAVSGRAVTAVVDKFREMYVNGGAFFGGFQAVDVDWVIRWFVGDHPQCPHEYDFFRHFLGSEAVQGAFPELLIHEALHPEPGFEWRQPDLAFKWSQGGPFTLGGEIAWRLNRGGAYVNSTVRSAKAERLGQAFAHSLIGDRHDDFRVYHSDAWWTEWFGAVVWDATWVLIDLRDAVVYLLCLTDTD